MSELLNKEISELSLMLRSKQITSLALTKLSLQTIADNSHLNAYITICQEDALRAAQQADEKLQAEDPSEQTNNPLLGIPISVKDMILTAGIKTTAGSKFLANFIPPYDATVVSRLKAAGAVIVGKTNTDEFAMGSSNETSFFGCVKNPYNPNCVPGGSSGGAAASVACGSVPAALGTDTGGSVRQPAAFTNLVGIKPTYGRVSRYGVIAYASSLDQVGVLARNCQDAYLVLKTISGHDSADSTSSKRPSLSKSQLSEGTDCLKGLRLGIPKEYFVAGIESEVQAAINKGISALESQGAKILPISLPHTEYALATYYIIAPAEASSNLSRYDGVRYGHRAKDCTDINQLYRESRSQGFGLEVKRRIMIGTHVLSTGYYDAYYLRAQKARRLITEDFRKAFEQCDLIVSPTTPTTAFELGAKTSDPLSMYLNDIFTIPVNLAGVPAISLPCGADQKGLPIGLQLIAPWWQEELLLNVGKEFESILPNNTKINGGGG